MFSYMRWKDMLCVIKEIIDPYTDQRKYHRSIQMSDINVETKSQ